MTDILYTFCHDIAESVVKHDKPIKPSLSI